MAIAFKGERTVAELNNNLGGFVKDSAFRIYDHGILLKGNVPVKHGDFVSWTGTRWKIESSLEYATSADVEAVEEQVEKLGNSLQWKGPATVAQLNAGITGIRPGWTYTLTDAGTLTDGSVVVDVGDEVAWTEDDEWFKVGGESGVKYVDRSTGYSDVSAAISRGQLPIMTVVSGGTAYYYLPFYNGSGRIEFRSIQDNSIDCFTWNGTAWVAGDSVIYGMGSDTKSEADIDQGVLAIDGGNVVTKVTLATVNAITFSVDERVPAFAIEIDNTGNSNDVTVTVNSFAGAALKPSVAGGSTVGAGKYVQLTCVGSCWTLAEFEAPVTP